MALRMPHHSQVVGCGIIAAAWLIIIINQRIDCPMKLRLPNTMRFIDDISSACCNEKVNDDLVEMEENYGSVNLDPPNFTDDELIRAIDRVQSFLDNRPLYLQICENEFAALLLKALGPSKITSSIVRDLFNEIDVDNDGHLSVEEIANYMIKVEQQSNMEKFTFLYDRMAHASYLGTFFYACASTISIAKNVFL